MILHDPRDGRPFTPSDDVNGDGLCFMCRSGAGVVRKLELVKGEGA